MAISLKIKYIFAIVLLILFANVSFVFAESSIITESPIVIYPPPPPADPAQSVPTPVYFKWGEVNGAMVYAYTLRPIGGEASTLFTNGLDTSPPGQIWIQPALINGAEYNFLVQGCEREDVDSCGPTSELLTFTVVLTGDPICGANGCESGEEQGGPFECLADCPVGGGPQSALENPISSKTLPQLLNNILNFLFGISIVVLPIIIVYAGILMLTAQGDPEKISRSRTILLWAVIAFMIILLARGLPAVLRGL